ncbi:MAG TPA: M14 family metallopeptidase [Pyrinomonadaceae bacterium]|nr:M14 family metallopeptidase [Pyrinomonadaceae bacterium]
MQRLSGHYFFCALLFLLITVNKESNAQSQTPPVPPDWQTHAERTDYRETPRYDETLEYSRKLAAAAPSQIRLTDFGRSGEGRALPLLIAAKGKTFTPAASRRAGKVVVFVQANIHAGETDGKDAGLALLRDILVLKTQPRLLEHVTLLFVPIYNVDGHERRSPYNRINQNGPVEMGWRANATNQNLNRDYMKADTPETRAWLRLWNEWSPDLFIDCHVTDGADFRYNVTYQFEQHENVPQPLRDWMKAAFDGRIVPATEALGNLLTTYMEFRDNRDPVGKGVEGFIGTPRFATGYVPLRNRPALLIETHMLKDYKTRVRATYDLLRAALEDVNRDPAGWLRAAKETDEAVAAEGRKYDPARKVALRVGFTDKSVPRVIKGVEFRTEKSDVSGAQRVIYGTKPYDYTVPFYNDSRALISVSTPLYYIIPPQWTEVIERLAAHGVHMQRLVEPLTVEVESYRFTEVKWGSASFEGRVLVTQKNQPLRERRTYVAGSVVVPMAQAAGRLAINLLEPDAPDSFLYWGFFNTIFEQKEYGEAYVVEKLAREMLSKDEKLRKEFEARVANDPQFAASARQRLNFFYDRSPYRDPLMNVYPVGRITTPLEARLTDFR